MAEDISPNEFDELKIYADAILPNAFFTRWFDQGNKQVIITKYVCILALLACLRVHAYVSWILALCV
jgi:hypothetical protein